MGVQVIFNQQHGPLPLTATFNAPSDAPSFIEVTGSVWTQTANQPIGIGVQLDGQQIGTAQIFSNAASTHRAVVSAYLPVQLKQGQHTLKLIQLTGTTTISDLNDLFTAVIHF
jgi:hypothetical protein